MQPLTLVYLLKLSIATTFLVYSSFLDLKERRVPNRVWKWMLITLSPLTIAEANTNQLIFGAAGSAYMVFLAYLFYRIGAWGALMQRQLWSSH
ncbi:A24 family peptidase [Ferroglobus placidus]|uniref:A24 family peptidase n=1 Tax=Ferroglobus placidus TaxID=54261 RepID=UPI0001B77C72|nr:A24 family peptidase [Ferroglobus placidus]